MAAFLALFTVLESLSMWNTEHWAAVMRVLLLLWLLAVGVILLQRAHVHVSPGVALFGGVLAAMTISELYRNQGVGLAAWLVYAGVFAAQRAARHDWSRDFVWAGTLIGALVLLSINTDAPWNPNVIGGAVVMFLPSAAVAQGRVKWIAFTVMLAAIISTGSRGAMMGAAVALAILYAPRALLAAPVLGAVLITFKPFQSALRLAYWNTALDALSADWLMGVGPGRVILPGLDARGGYEIHAHNSVLTLLTQFGFIGLVVVAVVLTLMRRAQFERWQLATLAAVGVQSLVDDPLAWLPVGVICAIILASERGPAQSIEKNLPVMEPV